MVAGQSYGGLAAAAVVVRRPDVARLAVVQSGSFWHRPGEERSFDEPGALTASLAGATGGRGRLAVQVGTDEGDMVPQARWFTEAARAAGHRVDYREYRGGHDYAWWYPSIVDGLKFLAQVGDGS